MIFIKSDGTYSNTKAGAIRSLVQQSTGADASGFGNTAYQTYSASVPALNYHGFVIFCDLPTNWHTSYWTIDYVKWSKGGEVYLTQSLDLDLSGNDDFTTTTFGGTFYGNGKTINITAFKSSSSNYITRGSVRRL